ncbi:MAG: hypothetical protein JXA23_00965 [Bacteroidales bacterium]|nr:hypothetical protein [Bacteroidales bacterium]
MMKQRLLIIGALILLLAIIGYMVVDLFFTGRDKRENLYDYRLSELRQTDSTPVAYREILHFTPGLSDLHGIAVDDSDRIYVTGSSSLEIYTPDGNLMLAFSLPDPAYCLTVAPGGDLLLGMEDHLEILSPEGELISRWKPEGEHVFLTSVVTNGKDIFIADAGEKNVSRYNWEGVLLNRIGDKDSLQGIPGWVIPSGYFDLGLGRDDELWVVNPGRHQLEAFRPDGSLISIWGESSMDVEGFCGCCNPTHFALLSDGSFVTGEKGIERVKIYRPSGEFNCLVAAPDQFDEGTRGLDLAVDSKDRILVLDPSRNQVRIFVYKDENDENR